MTALAQRLHEMILAEGPMPVERYMALCLADPLHGYYMRRDPIGAEGDFTTAPEISQMFGEIVGLWLAQAWIDLGMPVPCRLVELGPGRGTLMADALRAMRSVKGLPAALSVHLIETSPVLIAKQRETLTRQAPNIAFEWARSLDDVPDGPLLLVANEFFDALPIRQYLRRGAEWYERMVGLVDGALAFTIAPVPEPKISIAAPEGAILEIGYAGLDVMRRIGRRLADHGGAALVIDYGATRSAFADTLQAVKAHAFVDVLAFPGESDLTAHVDFAALAQAATGEGASIVALVEQGDFLRGLGIDQRAARLAASRPDRAGELGAAIARLTGRGAGEMGALFKVLALQAPQPRRND